MRYCGHMTQNSKVCAIGKTLNAEVSLLPDKVGKKRASYRAFLHSNKFKNCRFKDALLPPPEWNHLHVCGTRDWHAWSCVVLVLGSCTQQS